MKGMNQRRGGMEVEGWRFRRGIPMHSPASYVHLCIPYVYTSLATCTPCAFSNPLIKDDFGGRRDGDEFEFRYAAWGGLQIHGGRVKEMMMEPLNDASCLELLGNQSQREEVHPSCIFAY
jgi:hypothetical protein